MTTSSGARIRFCTSCGTEAGETRYCTVCGSPLQAVPEQRTEQPPAVAAEPPPPPAAADEVVEPEPEVVADEVVVDHVVPHEAVADTQLTSVLPIQPPAPQPEWHPEPQPAGAQTHPTLVAPLQDWFPGDTAEVAEDDAPAAVPAAAPRGRGARTAVLTLTALVAVGALGVAAYLGYERFAGGPADEALSSTAVEVGTTISAFSAADDVEAVAAAAGPAGAVADRVEGQLRLIGSPEGAFERAAVDHLQAEVELLRALAGLTDLAQDPLEQWGERHAAVRDAVDDETRTRAELVRAEPDAVEGRPDTRAMLTGLSSAVGAGLAADATDRGAEMLDTLAAARTTADLQAAADSVNAERPAVQSVLPSLSADSGRPVLEAYDGVLQALSRLSDLDAEDPDDWRSTRSDLSAAFGRLASAPGAPAELTTRTTAVLDGVDGMLVRAAAALADWRRAYDGAVADRDADTAALASYREVVSAQVQQFDALRADGQAFFDRVRAGSVDESDARMTLSSMSDSRRSIRAVLVDLTVPEGMGAAHDGLVGVLNRSIAAIDGATAILDSSTCWMECPFTGDHSAYTAFQRGSEGISEAYTAAVAQWGGAARDTETGITARGLPERPQV